MKRNRTKKLGEKKLSDKNKQDETDFNRMKKLL